MIPVKDSPEIPTQVRKVFDPFLKELTAVHKDNMVSVFLYGSAAGKNFVPGVSDINSVLVLRTVSLEALQKTLQPVARARRRRIQAPLIMTQEHIRSSLDVFPIEFLDMKEQYAVVYGEDVLKDIVIQDTHVRLFCEQQIKGRLIRIRQAYLEVGSKRRGVEALLKESLGSLFPVFRALIRWKGLSVPTRKEEVLKQLHEIFGVGTDTMSKIWKDRQNDERIDGRDVREIFGMYIKEVESLAQMVDKL